MYLASFRFGDRECVGARIDDDRLIDFRDVADRLGRAWDCPTMLDVGFGRRERRERPRPDCWRPLRRARMSSAYRWPMSCGVRRSRARGKICGVALNNSASDARKISSPDHPMFFFKPSTCLVGHRAAHCRPASNTWDFHPEPGARSRHFPHRQKCRPGVGHGPCLWLHHRQRRHRKRHARRGPGALLRALPETGQPGRGGEARATFVLYRAIQGRGFLRPRRAVAGDPRRGARPARPRRPSVRSAGRCSRKTTPAITPTGWKKSSPISRAT